MIPLMQYLAIAKTRIILPLLAPIVHHNTRLDITMLVVLLMSQKAHQAGAYLRFPSHEGLGRMKRLGVFVLPPGWDASPSQGYLQHFASTHLCIHLGGERHSQN